MTGVNVLEDGRFKKILRGLKSFFALMIFLVLPSMKLRVKFAILMTRITSELPEYSILFGIVNEDLRLAKASPDIDKEFHEV